MSERFGDTLEARTECKAKLADIDCAQHYRSRGNIHATLKLGGAVRELTVYNIQ